MSDHTPGPWYCHYATACAEQADGEYQEATAITNVDEQTYMSGGCRGDMVAIVPHDTAHEANARLIAAAPELLRACREMAEVIASMSDGGAAPYLEVIRMAEGKT